MRVRLEGRVEAWRKKEKKRGSGDGADCVAERGNGGCLGH